MTFLSLVRKEHHSVETLSHSASLEHNEAKLQGLLALLRNSAPWLSSKPAKWELPAPAAAPGTGSGALQRIHSGFFWNAKAILIAPEGPGANRVGVELKDTGAQLLQHCHSWGLWGAVMGPMCCRNAQLCVGWEIYALDIGGIFG